MTGMELFTDTLVLRTVTEAVLPEIVRMWNFFQGGVSLEETIDALNYMTQNHTRNASGSFYHLCLAVCRKEHSG